MLKRRRGSSPLPTVHEDEGSVSVMKRQRVIAPILNGEHRGWADSSPEEEDEWYDEDFPVEAFAGNPRGRQAFVQGSSHSNPPPQDPDSATYATTNYLLHNLHYAHQQRNSMLQMQSSHSSASTPMVPESSSHPYAPPMLPASRPYPVPTLSNALPQNPDIISANCNVPAREETLVRLQYEDHNKILGSLVLQRRRALNHDVQSSQTESLVSHEPSH